MSTLDEVTGPAPEATTTSTRWRPAYALDLVTRLAGVAFLFGGLILFYCAGQLHYFDVLADESLAEFADGIGAPMGLAIAAGLIAIVGGARPWAYRIAIGPMCFVIIQFTHETRTYSCDIHQGHSERLTTAMALLLAAWVLFVVALVAVLVTVLATRAWRRPATAPFVVWMVAMGALIYHLWYRVEAWDSVGMKFDMIPAWWWAVALAGFATTVLLLGITGAHPVRSVRAMTPALFGTLLLAMLLVFEVWKYWEVFFEVRQNWGYPATIVASLAAAVLYAVSREPDTESLEG